MGTVQLSERLRTLAEMVTCGNRVADVGCDHGFVSVYLVQQGISPGVIASDVRPGPLSRAREHVEEQGLEAYIETRLSDGLAQIRAGEADTLICAGMGGRLMQRILKQGESVALRFRELILQPQSELEEFRGFLRREGYRIVRENILREEGKYYFFMKAVPGEPSRAGKASPDAVPEPRREIPLYLADKYGGLLLEQQHPLLREYLEFMGENYRQVAERIGAQAGRTPRREKRLEQIRAELEDIGEALKFYTQEGR